MLSDCGTEEIVEEPRDSGRICTRPLYVSYLARWRESSFKVYGRETFRDVVHEAHTCMQAI